MGDIGIETAKLLNAFGCRVSYNKRYPLSPSQEKEYNVTYMSADDILKNCHTHSWKQQTLDQNNYDTLSQAFHLQHSFPYLHAAIEFSFLLLSD